MVVICSGETQAPADLLIAAANPTTVSGADPGTSSVVPSSWGPGEPFEGQPTTISPGAVAQWPSSSSIRSTGPPGSARPTTVREPPGVHSQPGGTFTTLCPNGPAAASTPGCRAVRASCSGDAFAGSKVAMV